MLKLQLKLKSTNVKIRRKHPKIEMDTLAWVNYQIIVFLCLPKSSANLLVIFII